MVACKEYKPQVGREEEKMEGKYDWQKNEVSFEKFFIKLIFFFFLMTFCNVDDSVYVWKMPTGSAVQYTV